MERFARLLASALRLLLALCALGLVLLALYVSLGRELAPLVGEYREEVAREASERTGLPVRIGTLEGHWRGFAPVVVARDIQLGEGDETVRLEQARLTPHVLDSLLTRQLRIDRLELDGLHLALREDADGQWQAEGLPARRAGGDPGKLLEALALPARLSLTGSQIVLLPHDGEPLVLNHLGLTLRNGAGGRQRLDGRMNLPDGQPLALRIDGRLNHDDWRRSALRAYLSLPQSDWSKWLPPSLTRGWRLAELKAGGEVWLNVEDGQPRTGAARLHAPRLVASYDEREPVTVGDLGVSLFFQRDGDDLRLRVADLAANLGDTRWGEVEMELLHQSQGEERWQLRADRLDLAPLAATVQALAPLPDAAVTWLQGLQPHGVLHNVNLDFWPQRQGAGRVAYAANLERVGVSAFHEVPAVENVGGTFSGNLGGGRLDASAQDLLLHLPRLFPEPWRYRSAHARLFWTLDEQALTLGSHLMRVEGDEGRLAGDMLIRLMRDPSREDYMDLRVGLSDGDARFTDKYLPSALPSMNKNLAEWLHTAIKGGRIEQGYFQWQGDLHHDAPPEAHAMSLYFRVHDAELDYQPGWPALSQADGEVWVEDSGVRVEASGGNILQSRVRDVTVDIPHVEPGEVSHLHVKGGLDSSVGDGLKILQDSPIGKNQTFAGWQGEGALKGELQLDIPLAKGQVGQSRVIVDFAADGARLQIPKPELELTRLAGAFRYDTDSGLSARNVSAQWRGTRLSGSIRAEGSKGNPRTRVLASGQVPVQTLLEWGGVSKAVPVQGRVPYQLDLLLAGRDSQLQVGSNLQGVAIDLPAPFGKAADESRQANWRMTLDGDERRYWATYANLASLAYAAPADRPLAGRGSLQLGGGAAILPGASGLQVRGRVAQVDAEAWQAVLKKYAGGDVQGASGLLRSADLRIDRFSGFGQTLENLTLDLRRVGSSWQLGLVSALASGQVVIPDLRSQPLQVRLDRLSLPKSEAIEAQDPSQVPDPLQNVDPHSLPAMDVSIRQILLGGKPVGAWNFRVRPTPAGASFDNLDLDLRGLHVGGAMRWEGQAGASRSFYKGRLEGKALEDVLAAWNFAPSVTSERFRLDVDGYWPGSPAHISLRRFGGTLDASLRKGQFVEVEGGAQALRVFGLLNFNAINRRLRLDFSDLLGKGLSYDRVEGVLAATDGVYVTRRPLKVEGPSSDLELNGTLDLAHDQIDAKLLVTLPVTNNLPLAALIVGAPAVGGALFVVDKLLGDRVARFASVQYSVRGPWQNPRIAFEKPFEKPR
ncbi:hypothetical protein D9M69_174150 [compost metagenome]